MQIAPDKLRALAQMRRLVAGRFGTEGGMLGLIQAARDSGAPVAFLRARGLTLAQVQAFLQRASVVEMVQAAALVRRRARARFAPDVDDVEVDASGPFVTLTASTDATTFARYFYTVDELVAELEEDVIDTPPSPAV